MENIKEKADEFIKKHVYWTIGASLIPVPLADIAAITAIQGELLKSLCKLYNIDYSAEKGKLWINALVNSTLSNMFAKMSASIIKFIPGAGTLIGMATLSILSGASTYALGEVFVKHFMSGGTLNDFDTKQVSEYYKQKTEEGKKIAKELKEKYLNYIKNPENKEKEKATAEKIKELDEMFQNKLITEEEYSKMRSDILKEFLD